MIQRSAECVPVTREIGLHLGALVGKDSKRGGVGEIATLGAEVFVDLIAFKRDICVSGIHRVDQNDHINGILPPVDSPEGSKPLRDFIVQEGKFLLLKAAHRFPILRGDDDVEHDTAATRFRWSALLLGKNSRGA